MLDQILGNAVSASQSSRVRYLEMLADVKEFVDGCALSFQNKVMTPTRERLRMVNDQRDLMLARAHAILNNAHEQNLATKAEIDAIIARRRGERKALIDRRAARRAYNIAYAERVRAGQI